MRSRKKVRKREDEGVKDVAEAGPEPTEIPEAAEEERAPTPEQVIEALSTELEELEDRHLRLVAEFDNFRKRTLRERAQTAERAQADLVRQLLESLDDLARVSELGSTDHDAAALLEGVQLVERKLLRALEQQGLRPINAAGQRFDPQIHDALTTVATGNPEEDEIVSQEIARGYAFKDTLLRPAAVEVRMYRPPEPGGDAESGADEDADEDEDES